MIISTKFVEIQQSLKKQSWESNTGVSDFIITSISGTPGLWLAKFENSELVYYRVTDAISEYITSTPKFSENGSYKNIAFGFDDGIEIRNGNIKNTLNYYGAPIGCYTSSIDKPFFMNVYLNYSSGTTNNIFLENQNSLISFGFTENSGCDVYLVDTSASITELSSCKHPSILIYSSGTNIEYTLYNGMTQILTSSVSFDYDTIRLNPDFSSGFISTIYFDFEYSAYQHFKTNRRMPNSAYSYFLWR